MRFLLLILLPFIMVGGPQDQNDLASLIADAESGDTIVLDAGIYTGRIGIPVDNLTIVGAGMPTFDGEKLTGGTIIQGSINLNNKVGVTISNLGIDTSGIDADGINSGGPRSGVRTYTSIQNVSILGSGFDNRYHAILLTTGSHNTVENVRLYRAAHCLALRSAWNQVSNVYAEDCRITSLIIKGAKNSGDANYNNVTNFSAYGTEPGIGGYILVEAMEQHSALYNNLSNIQSVNARESGIRVVALKESTIDGVNITNAVVSNNQGSDIAGSFQIKSASNVVLTNCLSVDSGGYGFRHDGGGESKLIGFRAVRPEKLRAIGHYSEYVPLEKDQQ